MHGGFLQHDVTSPSGAFQGRGVFPPPPLDAMLGSGHLLSDLRLTKALPDSVIMEDKQFLVDVLDSKNVIIS